MLLNNLILLLVLVLTVGLTYVEAYWRMQCGIIQTGRIDPILSFGQVSSHVHKLSGPSNINPSSTYYTNQNSSCTSCEVQADKSGYWTPQLYYQHSNGSFEEVPNSGMVVYYLGRGDNRTNIQPFPPGFRMLSGDAGARSYDNSTLTFGGSAGVTYVNGTVGNGTLTGGTWVNGTSAIGPQYTGRPVSDRVSFNCLDVSPLPETPNMNRTNCANGLRAQIQFQSCWDGVNLYLPANAHVAYMSQIDNGVCPPAYPIQLVHLFFEVLYGVNNINLDGGQFVFAQGDTTGYGFHGDFLNGWDMPTQTAALSQCANTDNGGQISACAPLTVSDTQQYSYNCPQQPPLINESARGMISQMPGCITITSGPEEATSADMSCPASVTVPAILPVPASDGPIATQLPVAGNTYSGWDYLGCGNEPISGGRSLTGATYSNLTGMTNQACQSFCVAQGYPIAGTEYGSQCYCGFSLNSNTSLGQPCNAMICAGDAGQLCGGPNVLNLWNSTTYTGLYHQIPTTVGFAFGTSVYAGCVTDSGNPRTLSLATLDNSTGMTLDACEAFCAGNNHPVWGTEWSQQCFCSDALPVASFFTSQSSCNMPCSGNVSQLCGAGNFLTVFKNPAVAPPFPGIVGAQFETSVYAGCVTDSGSPRTLALASFTNSTGMTLDACQAFCASAGYPIWGTEYSQECYCSSTLPAESDFTTQSSCTMRCKGNSSQICGAGGILTVFTNTAVSPPVQPFPSTIGAQFETSVYAGCVTDSGNPRTLSMASFTNSTGMTLDACQSFCAAKGYFVWGTEYSQECYCSSSLPASSYFTSQSSCTMPCKGNSSEICGAGNILTVFTNSAVATPSQPFPTTIGAIFETSVYLGCFIDSGNPRTLAMADIQNDDSMTLEACQSFCASNNYPIWGTEYSQECYCSSSIPSASYFTSQSSCTMACKGNSSEICGAGNILSVFNNTAVVPTPPAITANTVVNGSIYLGCASEATSGRALNAFSTTSPNMTNAYCQNFCASQNYALWGTEYTDECYCSNGLAAGSTYPQTGCTMPCAGTISSGSPFAAYANTCGGPNRLSLWNNTLYQPVKVVSSVGSYISQGCYSDNVNGRALASTSLVEPNMTVEACVGYCSSKGWSYAGVEYSDECYCGSGIINGGGPASSGCGMLCAGNQYEICGGPNRLNVYLSSA